MGRAGAQRNDPRRRARRAELTIAAEGTPPTKAMSLRISTGRIALQSDRVGLELANMSVRLNNGNGSFAPKVDYPTGDGPDSVAAADLNGDGKPDLAVANKDSDTVSVFFTTCLP
jgi:hypothetical protein